MSQIRYTVSAVATNYEPNQKTNMVQTKTYVLTQHYLNKIKGGWLKRHDITIDELECHKCRTPVNIGETVVTKITHSRTKRSYYHPSCARLCHIL